MMKRPLTAKRRGVTGDTERKGTGSIRHSAEGSGGAVASWMCQHLSLNTSIIAGTGRASRGCWNVVLKNLLPKWFCFIAHQGAVVLILFVPRTVVTAQVPTNMSSRQGSSQPLSPLLLQQQVVNLSGADTALGRGMEGCAARSFPPGSKQKKQTSQKVMQS